MDLNATICELQRIFASVIGERIVLRTRLDPSLKLINGDVRKIESVLVSLFMHARDAMPPNGELVVTTANLELDNAAAAEMKLSPGRYAQLQLLMTRRVETEQVREIVEQLHGAITVQSMADQRVAVTLALPQST